MLRSIAIPAFEGRMLTFDLLMTDARLATMSGGRYSVTEIGAVGIVEGKIGWAGRMTDLPEHSAADVQSMENRWVTPALIDCHTHLVFGGNRADEFAQRLEGASYEEIARAGGGIMSTVNATRSADYDSLYSQSSRRLTQLRSEGCATIEVKSGYGLNTESEVQMLRVARSLADEQGVDVITTFLGAHTVPEEYRDDADAYVDLICNEMLPAVQETGLADAVDAYCEPIAFSADQVARVFECARSFGLPVKLHADQLSDSGGAELAASFNALSADHLEYANTQGIEAMAGAGTVAVMLPGAFLTLGEKQLPPIDTFRANGVHSQLRRIAIRAPRPCARSEQQ